MLFANRGEKVLRNLVFHIISLLVNEPKVVYTITNEKLDGNTFSQASSRNIGRWKTMEYMLIKCSSTWTW